MSRALYVCNQEAAAALVANTAKTVNGVKAHANSGLELKKLRLSFDGVTASAVPVLVEICRCTWATNSPGTNSTTTTPKQVGGRVMTAGFTSARDWSAEPTVLEVLEEFTFSPYGGFYPYDFPLGDEYDCDLAHGFAVRLKAPAIVNARSGLWVARN